MVVGGGTVASRRVHALLGADADVVVVAPEVSARIRELADLGRLTWVERGYRTGDLDGAWLVQTATDSPVDDLVAADAEQARVWCLKGGDPDHATAWMPAVASVDDVHVAVSGGGDARRASVLRDAVATAASAPSSAAMRRSSRSTVGLAMRL